MDRLQIYTVHSGLNNKDNQKKHLQEAQKAYCWRAGISLPWLSQSRRAVLAEDGAGWLCPDPFQNWMKFHKGTIRSANVPSFSGEIWPYLLGFLPWSSCAINSPLLSTWAWDSFHLHSHLGATSLAADLTCKVFHPCRYQSLDPALLNWSLSSLEFSSCPAWLLPPPSQLALVTPWADPEIPARSLTSSCSQPPSS